MRQLYEPFVRTGKPILVMDPPSAELTKYAANAMLATRISFMNEIANFCDRVGADVRQVRKGMGTDSRIGPRFLFPGVGYGGSCFPKDVKALIRMGAGGRARPARRRGRGADERGAEGASSCPGWRRTSAALAGKTVAVWGLAFKPRTDDMREAPGVAIIEGLLAGGRHGPRLRPEGGGAGAPGLRGPGDAVRGGPTRRVTARTRSWS